VPGLIDSILLAGSDNAAVFAKGYQNARSGGYHIQQEPQEYAALLAVLRDYAPFHTALSIGIAAGGNERFLVEHVDVRQLVVLDDGNHPMHRIWGGPIHPGELEPHPERVPVDMPNRDAIRERIPLHEFIGDSHSKAAAKFLEELDFKFNLVAIDGDHSPAGVRQDWALVKPYLAPGAIVWFHDIALDEPGQTGARELWMELRRKHQVLLETRIKFGIGAVRI
jgi:hypothetical protein